MNLAEIRKMFIKLSGRYDLVLPDGSDDGADFFIHEGQRFVERLAESYGSGGMVSVPFSVGDYSNAINARVIEGVMAVSADGERWPLEKVLFKDLNNMYTTNAENVTKSVPVYYAPVPAQISDSVSDGVYNALMIFPPTDSELTVEVYGKIYADVLVDDSDSNYWSENHSMILILSALRYVEVINRNREGVKDYETAITNELTLVEKDFVEQEVAEFDALGG